MKKSLILFALLFVTSCSLAPDYHRPEMTIPAAWTSGATPADTIPSNWWESFKSPELGNLITQADQQNTDLKAGLHRIEQARAQVTIARSFLLPSIGADADLSYSDQRTNHTSYGIGANVSYEADLWRKNANDTQSARYSLAATQDDQAALLLTTRGDVAQRYFEILGLLAQKQLTADTIKTFQETMDIVQARFNEGAAAGLEVSQQKVALSNAQASLDSINNQLTTTENALAILLGKPPQQRQESFATSLDKLEIPFVAPLQPAALLERRPDLHALENDLKAANADIGVARAEIFPSLTISGSTSGLAAPVSAGPVFTNGLAASVLVNIFNAGRLNAQVTQVTERQKELAENYRGAALTAFRETEDALANLTAAQQRAEKYTSALTESRNAYQIAHDRYLNGASDFLELLDAQRSLLQAQQNNIQARLDRLVATLNLYRALGGGWSATTTTQ